MVPVLLKALTENEPVSIKDGVESLVGRTVKKVVVSQNPREPRTQVFLVLDNGTYYEFYGDVSSASWSSTGREDEAEQYAALFGGKITKYG